jgi:hypothetical protein
MNLNDDEYRLYCFNCSESEKKLMKCSICEYARYCDTECQLQDWKNHKTSCEKYKPLSLKTFNRMRNMPDEINKKLFKNKYLNSSLTALAKASKKIILIKLKNLNNIQTEVFNNSFCYTVEEYLKKAKKYNPSIYKMISNRMEYYNPEKRNIFVIRYSPENLIPIEYVECRF